MPDPTLAVSDSKKSKSDPLASGQALKEKEPERGQETEVLAQIQEKAREADLAAEREIKAAIGEESRLSQKEPEIGSELEEHGIKSPAQEASDVLKKGSVIELPISQDEYEKSQHLKVGGRQDAQKNVLGVASIIALAMLIRKMIKIAHEQARKFVFRKPSSAKATGGKEGGE